MRYYSMFRVLAVMGCLLGCSYSMFPAANFMPENEASPSRAEGKDTKNEENAKISIDAFKHDLPDLLRFPRRPDVSDIYLK